MTIIMKCWKLLLILSVLLCLCAGAGAESIWTATDLTPATEDMPLAQDITQEVLLNGEMNKEYLNEMRDGNYRTYWESNPYAERPGLYITPPEGKAVGGLVIKWRLMENINTCVQVRNGLGDWVNVASASDEFVVTYYPLSGLTEEFRVIAQGDARELLQICEIEVYTTGRLPENVQVWQSLPEKVDLLQIVSHPDDELLWFGGLLPTYAGEQRKEVLVACSSYRIYHRKFEMLDGLWHAGVRYHPVFLHLTDAQDRDMYGVLKLWGEDHAINVVATLLRKVHPDVLVLQDIKGEYGHPVHRALNYVARKAVPLAASVEYDPQAALRYGLWDVPKVYIHLYEENQIRMDWKQPLSAFDGKNGLEVATESFRMHVSQQGRWDVWDGGEWDNSLFGLWHTTVGPDVIGGDMFENIDKLYEEE